MIWFIIGFLKKTKTTGANEPFISVIIAAHNEENRLPDCLQALAEQNYPKEKYEIIVINDRSTDKTQNIIDDWKKRFHFIKSAKIEKPSKNRFPKKKALQTGINLSEGEILCFTDADCIPPRGWLQSCAAAFAKDVTMAVGPAPLVPATLSRTPFWQRLLVYESWFLSFISLAAIHNNFPLTCTGRNLSYRKSSFLKLAGFSTISHSLSGDDDLLMHQFQKSGDGKITAITNKESIVTSPTIETIDQLWRQKTRHFSAGKYYPVEKKIFYLIWNLCSLFITISPILALFGNLISLKASLLLLAAKLFIDFIFHFIGLREYKKSGLLKYFLLFEFVYPFYILIVGNAGLLKKPKW